jgi:nicotinamidase-related amidase
VEVKPLRAAKVERVYQSLEEIISPRHTTLVIVDMQNDLCHPDGAFARGGLDLRDIQNAIPNVIRTVDAARKAEVFVTWLLNTHLPDGLSNAPSLERMRCHYRMPEHCVEGTWGHALVDGLLPCHDDLIIKKHRSSGFTGTSLDMLLNANAIETIVAIGVATEGCVDSTVREAIFHNYYAVCITDAMASTRRELHEAAVTIMRARYDCLETDEIVAFWSRPGHAGGHRQ